MRLCDNLDPSTGELLTQRMKSERRVFFDFTCSAPKSVSIMAVTMNDERILRAHQLAARMAAKELASFAAARVRKQGAMEDRFTGSVVGAEFLHNSSRAPDPQLHTHFTIFNSTFDPVEQRWKALQTSAMFNAIHYATEVYRNDLAGRLEALGYETVRTANAFEIRGVSQTLCERFSKRAKERDAVVAEMEERLGRKLTNNEVSHAVHQTRSRKLKGISTEEVCNRQLAQMSAPELAVLRAVKERAVASPVPRERVSVEQALSYAKEHVFERNSVVPQEQLFEHALIEGRGQLDLGELKGKVCASSEFIRAGGLTIGTPGAQVSTRQILETELYLIDRMNAGKNAFAPLNPRFSLSGQLGDNQRKALELMLHSPDQFTGIRGLAGTGKSTALTELTRAIAAAGYEPFVCTPTGSAADVLRKDGFPAVTLQRLLVDQKLQASIGPRSVLILDEAGAVGIDDMKRFFELAVAQGARGIFSGDTGQHSSVPRGDALRILEEHSRYSFGQLTRIRRQRQKDYRNVVELAANKQPVDAFDRLDSMGNIHEPARVYEAATRAYLNALDEGHSALLVSPTWAEIDALTAEVRNTLQDRGIVGKSEVSRGVLDSLSWTEAQKCKVASYQPGQVLLFQQDADLFRQHETATVVSASKKSLLVQCEDGSQRLFQLRKRHAFDVCEARQLAIAPGDKLLLQANHCQKSTGVNAALVNGQLVEVKTVDGSGRIELTDGRVIPPNYRQFCHGYAVTSHASQGKTVDEVLLVASSRSLGAVNREQFYVSVSRGRERCQIFTDDKELLRDTISRSHKRTAALELAGLAEVLKREGFASQPRQTVPDLQEGVTKKTDAPRRRWGVSPIRCVELTRLFHQWAAKVQAIIRSHTQAVKVENHSESEAHSQTVKPDQSQVQAQTRTETHLPTQKITQRPPMQQTQHPQQSRPRGISI